MLVKDKMAHREKIVSRRKELRDTIRQAALEEFASRGFDGASTQSIAQRAGISKPQLHYYISSKEELYEEVLEQIILGWREIYSVSMSEGEPRKILREYVRRKIEFGYQNPNAYRLYAIEMASGAPFLSKRWEPFLENVRRQAKVIQSWVDNKLIKPVDPILFQIHLWAITQHYADFNIQVRALLKLKKDDVLDTEHIIDEATTLFMRVCGLAEDAKPKAATKRVSAKRS